MLSFWDCYSSIGSRSVVYHGSSCDTTDMLERMSEYGIGRSCVFHNYAKEVDPLEGNEMLEREVSEHPDILFPIYSVMPDHTGEFPAIEEYFGVRRGNRISATAFPASHNYRVCLTNTGDMFSGLEKLNALFFIEYDQISFDDLEWVLGSFPKLTVVFTGLTYRTDRNLIPLALRYDNLLVETSGLRGHGSLEYYCGKIGAERLLFGAGMSANAGSVPVSFIHNAELSPQEKEMIACKNLENLLKQEVQNG